MMARLTYLAVLEYNGKNGYGVYFPDVLGCISYGDTVEEALRMAAEALELHISGIIEDGDPLPERTDTIPELKKGDLVTAITVDREAVVA
ncbi:hypothetical protein FACS1894172_09210 [Spirochaetia bacterium]|nr:hypothetical protein FACS1894172_09210 [Spirochaetia bacterium]